MRVALLTANLGGFDRLGDNQDQSLPFDNFEFSDDNFPPRAKAMTPRLQAKIPKCFGWQLQSGYEYYMWLDGNLSLKHPDALKYFYANCQDADVVVLKHPDRDTIYWEYRYNYRGLHNNAPSNYLRNRYTNELLDEQYAVIKDDKDYVDDFLVNGGVFMYRSTPEVQAMLKEWWYHISRYLVMDQLSWAYVLKKSGLRVKVLPDVFRDCEWIESRRHAK